VNRRTFHRVVGGAVLGTALKPSKAVALPARVPEEPSGVPFKFSVMLWTIYRNLPFTERLEKVADAGYDSVELVSEFENWTDDEYRVALNKGKSLGWGLTRCLPIAITASVR
jgi:hydroxypyruvate isomerase